MQKGCSINNAGYASFNLGNIINDGEHYNSKPKKKTNYLDRVIEYCREQGITYTEFQRLEAFGKIPKTIMNKLRGKEWLALKEKEEAKKHNVKQSEAFKIAYKIVELEDRQANIDEYYIAYTLGCSVDDIRSDTVIKMKEEIRRTREKARKERKDTK